MNLPTHKINYKTETILRWIVLGTVFFVILNRAWMSDDAYITLRTVDNFINGYGLTWNVNERVEVYTHPLWMLFLSFFYFFTHEAYLTTIFVSLGLMLFTLIYLQFKIKYLSQFILVFLALGLSNAFVDFATSGLENVLSYVLFTLFFFQFFNNKDLKDNYFRIVFIAGLIGLNRLDLLLLVFPVLIYVFFQQPNKWHAIKVGFLAVSPLIAWEIFSYIYYGYMFPNTYYAKTNSGISIGALMMQGLYYFIVTFLSDPVTLVAISIGLFKNLLEKNILLRLLNFGIIIYLVYILKIGGDFMVGRFFAVPFLIIVLIFSQTLIGKLNNPKTLFLSGLLILFGLLSPFPTIYPDKTSPYLLWFKGITNERQFYFENTGLLSDGTFKNIPKHKWIDYGKELRKISQNNGGLIIVHENIGFLGYYAGNDVYIVDEYAIGNAYLAHQPMNDYSNWRIGHFRREVTTDYLLSLKLGENLIEDKNLKELFDEVSIKTKTNVWNKNRLLSIIPFVN